QAARLEVGIEDVGAHPARIQRRHELAAEKRLAGADLAGDLDEALAVRDGHEEGIERFLDAAAGKEIIRVRGNAERQLAQPEVAQVIHCARPPPRRASGFMESIRVRVSFRSRSHSRSDWIRVGLRRMTSSFLTSCRLVLRRNLPM